MNRKKNIFMFSGQGSQYYHMGKELYENEPVFRNWIHELDSIPQKILGESVVDKIYSKSRSKADMFSRTAYTHPAIFMIEFSLAQLLARYHVAPDFVFGSSLGEFVSAVLAKIIGVEDALELVIRQAVCIENSCPPGSMIAILDKPKLYATVDIIKNNSVIAGINFENHFVVSGLKNQCDIIAVYLKQNNIIFNELPVSHGFHSPHVEPAHSRFTEEMSRYFFEQPRIPFLSSLYGKQIDTIDTHYFWNIVVAPILFREALASMEHNEDAGYNYIDLGPSGTLANFVKYNNMGKNTFQIFTAMTPFGNEMKNIASIRNSCAG